MPVYNVYDYIRESLESIFSQDYKEFELIIVNDGSTDGSETVCEEFKEKYPNKIKIINQENKGLLLARREGLKIASGSYILSIDSDDTLMPNSLEKIKKCIEITQCDVLFFDAISEFENRNSIYNYPFSNMEIFEREKKKNIYSLIYNGTSFNNIWNKVIKMELVGKEADYHDFRNVTLGEDLLQVLPIVTNAKKIVYLDQKCYYYRKNEFSMTQTFNPASFSSIRRVTNVLKKYIAKWGCQSEPNVFLFWSIFPVLDSIIRSKNINLSQNSNKLKKFFIELSNDDDFLQCYSQKNNLSLSKSDNLLLSSLYNKRVNFIFFLIFCYQKLNIIRKK